MTRKIDKINPLKILSLLLSLSVLLSFPRVYADSAESLLKGGIIVNNMIKCLSAGDNSESQTQGENIKAIRMADSLPDGFIPSENNTVSVPESGLPVYIFFDNNDDAGIMYFYTEGSKIVMNPDSSFMFFNLPSLTDISGLADWDASHVTNMCSMFSGDSSLTDALALKNWNTSNVTDMSFMFSRTLSMMVVDVSGWNTSKVTNMSNMFQVGDSWKGNGQLIEIVGLGGLDVSNVTDMTCMFYGAGQMTHYDVAGWDVSKVESMNHMFGDNFNLRSLDLSGWNVSSVKTIYCMFDDNHLLKTIGDVSHWNTISLIDAGSWLNDAIAFVGDNSGTLDLSGWNTSNLKSSGEMFLGTKIRYIDLSGWTFDSMTNDAWEGAGRGIYYEFGNADNLLCGFGNMFGTMWKLKSVYITQQSMDSYNAAVERGVNTQDMWANSTISAFTVK